MKTKTVLAALASALVFGAMPAGAALMLQLSDGTNPTVTIADGGAGDMNAAQNGHLLFSQSIGAWIVNAGSGVGSPLLGPANMDLSSLHISSTPSGTPAGSLTVMLTETGLTLGGGSSIASFLGSIGGTTNGAVEWSLHVDDADGAFSLSQLIGMNEFNSGGGTVPLGFSGDFTNAAMITDTFSMTLRMVITHGDLTRSTSFNFSGVGLSQAVPEPATLLLLGVGLVAIGFTRRRMQA